jgi:hypothetical protein
VPPWHPEVTHPFRSSHSGKGRQSRRRGFERVKRKTRGRRRENAIQFAAFCASDRWTGKGK